MERKCYIFFIAFLLNPLSLVYCEECNLIKPNIRVNNVNRLNFGVLLPSKIPSSGGFPEGIHQVIMPAIELAVQTVTASDGYLNDFNITIIYRDTQWSSTYGPLAAFDLHTRFKPDAFFGPIFEYALAPVARYSGIWDIPVITPSGQAEALTFKTLHYPTLTRMLGSYKHVGIALKGILKHFNWHHAALIHFNHQRSSGLGNSNCYLTLGGFYQIFKTVENYGFDNTNANLTSFRDILRNLKKKARIVIMCASPDNIRNIMLAAEELNMVGSGEYVFFNIELFSNLSPTKVQPWYKKNDTNENNERAKLAYTALLTVVAKQPNNNEYTEFSDRLKALAATKYNYTFAEDEPVSTFVTAFYDAVLLYAYALNKSMELDFDVLNRPLNGTRMTELMWNQSFPGITGDVIIDSNGDRISDYSLLDMNPETGYFEVVANYLAIGGYQNEADKTIHWPGGRKDPPPDKPVCGYDGSLCPDNSIPGYAILSMILFAILIISMIVSFIGYRYYRQEAEINSMTWKVNFNDVLPCNPTSRHRGSRFSLAKRGSQVTIYSEDLGSMAGDRQLFIPIGFYKGNKIAIKKIDPRNISLNRAQMLELKKMKDLQHDHLVRFYGACIDPPNTCILTEYCPKGSLQDILENESIKLDWMFKLSLMHDIVRGMHFLHSTDIRSHGNLKSSNCVVDSRFVLKITDFGLHNLRKRHDDDDLDNEDSYAYWRKMLWTAPELLRLEDRPFEGTQKGDVYSFGIIVHEIVSRQGPFYRDDNEEKSPREIIQLVIDGPSKLCGIPFRPRIDDYTFDDVNKIMQQCWSEEPNCRPDFQALKITIHRINRENETGNIVDNLLRRMEQYANNLEGLVEERTQDYLEEKKKCEELLYQLLPKSVAAQLILGKPVMAETFEQVTIYFSDIVGFTSISAASTPMQVVDLLNDLYTCFDSIVENFDVYKVETIGDAYMVVSGLPVRNGKLHSREVARLALALLRAVVKFRIRHRPDEQLKLRIGLHSGPVVAGVVGLKMPRYCLFGDTVNTASRMESNGEALKIHISQDTKKLLDTFGTFDVVERGYVEMKGKGKQLTYWLTGETPTPEKKLNNGGASFDSTYSSDDGIVAKQMNGNIKQLNSLTLKHDKPNNHVNNSPTKLQLNNLVKTNKIRNQINKICNLSDEKMKNVTQPLLTEING